MKIIKLFLVLVLLAQFSCIHRRSISGDDIGSFDISKNDSLILFTLSVNYRTSIYQIGTDGRNLRCLVAANPDSNFYNPRYSKDNSKITFIGASLKTQKTSIYLANIGGSGRKIIRHSNDGSAEVFLSECDNKIYYIEYSGHGGFSNGAHGADIYVMSPEGKDVKKLTNFNAYEIFSLSEFDCDRLLVDMTQHSETQRNGPMILISKSSGDTVGRIYPKNSLKDISWALRSPTYSKNYNVTGFAFPYELYMMDMATKNAQLVARHKKNPIYEFHFFNKQKRVVYVAENEKKFYIVNFDGSNPKEIVVNNGNTTENIMRVEE